MKTKYYRWTTLASALGVSISPISAGVTLMNVNAGNGNFTDIGAGIFMDQNLSNTGVTMASRQNGSSYEFGLIPTPTGPPTGSFNTAGEFDITGRPGASSTYSVTFSIDSGEALNYIAYTGGALNGFDYDADTGMVTMSVTPVGASKSANNAAGGTMLGISVSTYDTSSPAGNQGGSIFSSSMWWGDISPLENSGGYGDSNSYIGANFDGTNGENVDFNYYVPMTVLRDNPRCNMESLDDVAFTFRKTTGLTITPTISIEYFTNGSLEGSPDYIPSEFINAGSNGGGSSFSFADNDTASNYVVISASNDSWSDANVALGSAVPEPSSLALTALTGVGFLVRRRK
ncbi:MAG: PEP-CTERM sorting domain-containing protein [Akkermansiaceae bacterium]